VVEVEGLEVLGGAAPFAGGDRDVSGVASEDGGAIGGRRAEEAAVGHGPAARDVDVPEDAPGIVMPIRANPTEDADDEQEEREEGCGVDQAGTGASHPGDSSRTGDVVTYWLREDWARKGVVHSFQSLPCSSVAKRRPVGFSKT
jgi:hypothetical protein